MRIVDVEKLKELEELLASEDTKNLLITFVDSEVYELYQFSDVDEGECAATVIQQIIMAEGKREFFKSGSGMLFKLSEVLEAKNPKTNEVIFRS